MAEVLLLAQGRTVYYGCTQSVSNYFNSTGLMCKPYFNRADFMLEIVSDLTHENIIDKVEREEKQNGDARSGNQSTKGSTDKGAALQQSNGSQREANDDGKPSSGPKDGIDLEKGIAADLLKDTLPDKTFDAEGGEGEKQLVRRLPLLWAERADEIMEVEKNARDKQQKKADDAQESVHGNSKQNGHSNAHSSSGKDGGVQVLTLSEKRLADASLDEDGDNSSRWPLTWWQQMVLLLSRSFVQHKGELITWLYALQVLGIATVCSLVWFQTPRRVDTLTEQTGALFFITTFWSFTPLFNSLTTFPQERAIIVKERKSGSCQMLTATDPNSLVVDFALRFVCSQCVFAFLFPLLQIASPPTSQPRYSQRHPSRSAHCCTRVARTHKKCTAALPSQGWHVLTVSFSFVSLCAARLSGRFPSFYVFHDPF